MNEEETHQLRNSLTVIKGNLDLIKFTVNPQQDKKFLQGAQDEIQNLLILIEQSEIKK